MKASRQKQSALAHKLVEASYEAGAPSKARVEAILAALRMRPGKERRDLLRAYLVLMRREEAARTLTIEHAGPLDAASRQSIVERMARRTRRSLVVAEWAAPELIGGLRVRLGDDLFDASISGILARLK